VNGAALKDAFLAEARKSSMVMYSSLLAQAQRIDVDGNQIKLTFAASQKCGATFEKYKPNLEAIALRLAGRKILILADLVGKEPVSSESGAAPVDPAKKSALKEQAMADPSVQALFEVFPGDIRDVEEV